MKLTIPLRDVLQIDLLKGAEILAGEKGLDNSILSVNVMEVPDVLEWVRPGEFLLTTAYVFRDDISSIEQIIPELSSRSVCGLGIKTQRYIEEVPEEALELANRIDFPIIRIPQEVPYGELIKEIFNYIIGQQRDLLVQINDFNNTLREIMLKRGGMQEIAEQIYQATNAPVIIHDEIFRDYYISCPDEDTKKLIEGHYHKLLASPTSIINQKQNRIQYIATGENGFNRYSIPIYFDNTQYGNIFIWDTKNSLRQSSLFVIESITSLIALDILNRAILVERENVHQATFLEQLLDSDPEEQKKAIDNSKLYLFDENKSSQVIMLIMGQEYKDNNSTLAQKLDTELLYLTNRLKKKYSSYFLTTRDNDRAIFLLQFAESCPDDLRYQRCEEFIAILLEHLEQQNKLSDSFIGVGSCMNDYRDLSKSLKQAEQAVKILNSRDSQEDKVLFYEDMEVLHILGHPVIKQDALAYANGILSSIDETDSKKRDDFIDTIRAYFEAGGNLRRVSEILFTHYNTVLYRINRIRDVYGVDLRDPDTAFDFQLALKIKELLQ